jgi:hypothetical protein
VGLPLLLRGLAVGLAPLGAGQGDLLRGDVAAQLVHQGEALERVLGVEHAGARAGLLLARGLALGAGVGGGGLVAVLVAAAVGVLQVVVDVAAVERGAAADDRHGDAELAHGLEVLLHDDGALDEQAAHADRVGLVLAGGGEDRVERLLDAEVDDRVAVVAEDDVDEVLADVVDVALDGGEHHAALARAGGARQVGLEVADGRLHGLGGLEHERELHLAGAEQLADDAHAVEQDVVDDVEGGVGLQGLVEEGLDADLVAVDDAAFDLLGEREDGLLGLVHVDLLGAGEPVDEGEQRVVAVAAAVVDQVAGDLQVVLAELVGRDDLLGVEDRRVEAVLAGLGQVDRV